MISGRVGNMWSNTNSWNQSCSMSIINSSDDSTICLSSSNLCNCIGLGLSLGLSLAVSMEIRVGMIGCRVGNMWNNTNSWDQSCSMSIINSSDDSTICLSSSNLCNCIGLGLSLGLSLAVSM